jgi:hypothetical protein
VFRHFQPELLRAKLGPALRVLVDALLRPNMVRPLWGSIELRVLDLVWRKGDQRLPSIIGFRTLARFQLLTLCLGVWI